MDILGSLNSLLSVRDRYELLEEVCGGLLYVAAEAQGDELPPVPGDRGLLPQLDFETLAMLAERLRVPHTRVSTAVIPAIEAVREVLEVSDLAPPSATPRTSG